MQYKYKDSNWKGAPKLKASDPTKVEIRASVTTEIVGDTYGFIKIDAFVAECPVTMTGLQMEASVIAQATAFSTAKYPNT